MADEKHDTASAAEPHHESSPPDYYVDRPAGWIYRGKKVFGSEIWYASPKAQLLIVAFACFLCPGMFNALAGIGGGGQIDTKANDLSNTALYAVFAGVSFFAGTIANRLGVRLTLAFGGVGYCVYGASFLCYSHTQNKGFVIFAGAFLGLCAGLLWTAQGAIMMSYPTEEHKGRYISWFWIIFNMGAVVGSIILLAQNIDNKTGPVTDGTYAAFIVLMFLGAVISLCIVNADKVIREDNTKVILMKNPTWKTEFMGLFDILIEEPWIVLLFPMFFVSNFFYAYQNNGLNATHFNTRTRALNGLLYWLAQIFGAIVIGYALDYQGMRRSLRAKIAFGVLVVFTFAIWGGGWAWQKDQVSRAEATSDDYVKLDWTDGSKFLGPMFLYFFYGFYDAVWQTCIYWYMGSLSNSGRKAANLAGFYKALVSYALDSHHLEFNTFFATTWGLLGGALVFAAPVVWFKIKDHVSVEDDLKYSDETVQDVVVGQDKKLDHDV